MNKKVLLLASADRADGGDVAKRLAALSVRSHLRCLRTLGFCHIRGVPGSWAVRAHSLYRLFILLLNGVYLLQHFIYAYQERSNMDKLAHTMFLLLCFLTSFVKQLVFHRDIARIDRLIDLLDEAVLNSEEGGACAILRAGAAEARRVHVVYAGTAEITCLLWLIFPVLRYYRHQPLEFPFWCPLPPNFKPLSFTVVLLYSFWATSFVGLGNTTMDAFIGTVLFQCKMQFTILRHNLDTLVERATYHQKKFGGDLNKIMMKLFVESLKHQEKIYEVAALVQDVFGGAVLVQFAVGGWILCMAAYKIVSLSVFGIEFISTCLFIACILAELFIYCYYGNEVTIEVCNTMQSGLLAEAMYTTAWYDASTKTRRALILGMERARRPLKPTAGRIVPLSLETFLKILKSSYSIYAMLRQTK